MSSLASAVQASEERGLVALPAIVAQLVFVLILVLLVTSPPPPPHVAELHGDRGRGGAAAHAQRHGAAAAQRTQELLHASARQCARAVAQRQGLQGGDPEEGPGLHLWPGGREPPAANQVGQATVEAGGAEGEAGAAPQLMGGEGRASEPGLGCSRTIWGALYKDWGVEGVGARCRNVCHAENGTFQENSQ